MIHLDYEDYLAFLGIHSHPSRKTIFDKIKKELSISSSLIWQQNLEKIQKGVVYQGAVEKVTKTASSIIGVLRRQKVQQLFSCSTLEEQRKFVDEKWDTRGWKMAFNVFLNPLITSFFFKDPGLYQHIDSSIQTNDYIYSRMHAALKRFPVRESILISLVLKGEIFKEGFSPYLTEEGYNKIRSRLNRASFQTIDLISYLERAPDASIDCFSLSDVASYLSESDFIRLSKALIRTARPGARFCIRQLMSRYTLPKEISPFFKRDIQLEHALEQQDRCFLYHFTVGKICK